MSMQPRIHVLTLGVADLERSLAFCRALGFHSEGIIGTEFPGGTAAMFELGGGLTLAIYGRDDLAADANSTFDAPGRGEFSIGIWWGRAIRSTRSWPPRRRPGRD